MQIERRPGVRHRLGGDLDFGLGFGDRFRPWPELEQNQLGLCRLALQAGLLEDLLSIGKLLRRNLLPSGQRTQAVDHRLRVLDSDFPLCDGKFGGPALLNPRLGFEQHESRLQTVEGGQFLRQCSPGNRRIELDDRLLRFDRISQVDEQPMDVPLNRGGE